MGGRGASSATRLANIRIMPSIGAKYYFPDKVRDTDGTLRQLKLMSEVTGIKAIAGAGASKKIRDVKRLCKKYGGSSLKWRKMRGTAIIDDGGIDYKVELHWYNKIGDVRVHEVKIKRYLY